ncbi:titin-like isoform X12 [Trichoplusia ni]|uniref:Hemolin n=1 Tax=Trichoplusia ni TaxID=7111 RepID=A0A7E5WPY0_TRINI|nr:titin-like isoform X12 [Trichoplusia ni]
MDGEPIKISCIIEGQPWPHIDWYHDGESVQRARDITVARQESGLCELCIKEAFPEMSGTYSCVATNEYGSCNCECTVYIEAYEYVPSASEEDILSDEKTSDIEEFAPRIVKALPTVVSTTVGELTRLEAKAIGMPKPQVRWLKQGVEIVQSQEYQIEEMEDGTSILIIPEVYQDDTGEIVFEAYNALGETSTIAALSVESIIGTKEYRKPEWVTHMEELQAALKATQSVPTFVKDILGERVDEEEAVTFEAVYSGNPTPEIIWYKDDKVIRTDERFTIENKDNRTTCTVKKCVKELEGTYMCKAVSDIGMAITKAKLQVWGAAEKSRKAKLKDKKEKIAKAVKQVVREEIATEVQEEAPVVEKPKTIKKVDKKSAKTVISEADHVETVDVATYKKVDKKETKPKPKEEKAEPIVTPHDYLVSSQTEKEETVQPLEESYEAQKGIIKMVESDSRVVAEINELLEVINAKEFGPGESPLRELAKIGFMMRSGITTEEIESLYDSQYFPALRVPQSQSALVRLVERQGHGALITEVLTEETTQDEDVIAAKVGFRAFLKMVELKHSSVEEVIAHLYPEDFKPRSWEQKEAHEVIVESSAEHTAETHTATVIKDTTKVSEVEKQDLKEKEQVKRKKHIKQKIAFEERNIEEISTEENIKTLNTRQPKEKQEHILEDETTNIEKVDTPYVTLIATDISDSNIEVVSASQVTHIISEKAVTDVTANLKIDTNYSIIADMQEAQEKETPLQIKENSKITIKPSLSELEPLLITEIEINSSVGDYQTHKSAIENKAHKGIVPAEYFVTSEVQPNMSTSDFKEEDKKPENAKRTIILKDALNVSEEVASVKESHFHESATKTTNATVTFSPLVGLNVLEVNEEMKESPVEVGNLEKAATSKLNFNLLESLQVGEVFVEDKSGKYYPELIVPTETARKDVLVSNQVVTQVPNVQESEGILSALKMPPAQEAYVDIASKDSLVISVEELHEKEDNEILQHESELSISEPVSQKTRKSLTIANEVKITSEFVNEQTVPYTEKKPVTMESKVSTADEDLHEISITEQETEFTELSHTSPKSSDIEESEEIVTKFVQAPGNAEPIQIKTKRTIIRKKKRTQHDENEGDIVIEETLEDEEPSKSNKDVGHDLNIEEYEGDDTSETNINEKSTIEMPDEFLHIPKMQNQVQIEELHDIDETVNLEFKNKKESKKTIRSKTKVTVTEDKFTPLNDTQEVTEETRPVEIVELPEDLTVLETKSPDGKPKQKKIIKRVIKKKVGPKVETTEIVTEQEDDQQPVVSVYKSEELTDDTFTPLKDLQEPDKAQVIEESPETVQLTQVRSETGDVKIVKTTKRVIKKKKGPKQEVTEITTIEKDDEAPITTVTVTEDKAPEDVEEQKPVETIELPEETTVEESVTPDGKKTHKKITKRIIKKKVGPKLETTQITTEQSDDSTPITTVHKTEELIDDTTTPLEYSQPTDYAKVVEETPETVQISQVRTETGDVKTVKTTKRVIKKKKGKKDEVTEITTIQKDDEAPITTVTVTEDIPEHEEDMQPVEIVELPEETTVEETKSPDGKPKQKKVTKRVIKKKVGPKVETTEIVTEQEDDQQPVVSVYKSEELTDDTVTPLKDLQEPDKAQVIEETPETVQVTQVQTETGDVKTVKTTKRVIKKKKGPKQEVTEITTIEKDDEAPITTVTVTEDKAPEDVEEQKPVETIELPEETTVEESVTPDGKKTHKKITKRIIKKKVGPKLETTQITTEQSDDSTPITTVHKTEELIDDTTTPLEYSQPTDYAKVVEETPETVQISQVRTETGDVKTVKTTKRVIKKKKGKKDEVTEITTIQKDDEAPITTVTVTEDTPVHEEDTQQVEIVELPEETTVEETKSPDGKPKQKKVTKRVIKKKVGPKVETTEIVTEQEDDHQPVVSVYKSEELTDDTVTPLKDLKEPDTAQVIEETPETVQVTQVQTETGDVKTVKTTKRVIKKKKGPKQEVTEITTIEKDDEAPITTVTVTEDKAPEDVEEQKPVETFELPEETTVEESVTPDGDVETVKTTKRVIKKKKGPKEEVTEITTIQKDDEAPITTVTVTEDTPEHVEDLQPIEIVELPQETTVEETKSPDGKPKQKKVTKRVIKKKVGPKVETTEIVTEQEDDQQPVVSVYKSEELTDDTFTPLKDLQEPDKAQVIEETPETVQVTQVRSETGDVKTVKTTKRVIKKKKGPKQEVTEITTIEKDDEAPITTVTVTEKQAPQEAEDHQPVEIVELPEETTFEDSVGPDGKKTHTKIIRRTIKKKVGPKVKTTHITSEHTDDTLPIITVHNTEELAYDTATPLTHLHDTHNADVVEELPETVKVTQVRTLSGDVETVKTTKRVIKKKKGPKEEVTEITTIQKDYEAPITTVTVTEDTPEHVEDLQPIEIVELPQETTVEETKSPDGKPKQKKVTKRVIKKKVGPKVETTEIVTEQEDDQQPVVSVYKSEELTDDTVTPLKDLQEPDKAQVIEETPETVQVTQVRSETGDVKTVKTTKRVIKKKKGPKQEVTEITTIEKDDEAPITTVTVTEKQAPQEAEDHQPVEIVELPEETTFEDSVGPDGDVETVKTTKRVIKKKKGPKEEVTEITTIQKDDEAPITTVTVTEDTPEHVEDLQPIEIVELPQETTVEETKSPDGKPKQKKVTKRVIKKKVGPKVETTEIVTEQEDDQQPVVSVYKSEELTDDTFTPLKDLQEPDKAQVIEETPETVQVTQVRSETGDVKTVKTTKRVIKKKKGPKQEVTEITTIEKDDEAPITTVTVTEKQAPQEAQDQQPVEIVELPEETTFEDSVGPDGKKTHTKIIRRTIKKKVGPKVKTTHITSEHTDDTLPIITVHNTEELTYDTATPLTHLHDTHNADVVEELPETVKVTQVRTLSGDVETVKTTKRVIKKKKGPKEEVTEITTIQKDDEAPITTVTVTEDTPEHVEDLQPIEIVELPQETTVEETKSPDGKPKQKKVTKRVVKKKVGPKVETTEIVTEQEDDQQPVVSVYKSEELTDDTVTPLKDLQEPDKAQVIEETPETVQVTQVRSETGDVKTVKTTKRVIKKKKGPKQEVTEITTIEKDDEAPITTVTVTEKQAPQEAQDQQPVEIVELPEETTFEDSVGPDGKKTHTKIIRRTIKKKVGPKVKTTHITSEHTDDTLPIITVHNTEELAYDTATPLTHLHDTHNADVVEELPETVKVTQVRTLSGDVETVKTTKRVIKKKKGPKEEVTEITTIQKDYEAPITTVTVTEDTPEHVEDLQPIEIVELPQETTVEETKSPDGKPKQKKVTKRVIKKKVGPKVETTEIVTEQEDDQQPVVSVYKSEELTDDTVTPLKDLQEPDKAQVIEETPETVQVTQVRSETGDVKTVKTTKRVIKKKKGPKQEVTEITTIEKDDEAPITTVTVTEKQAPQEAEDHQPVEIVELPEETTFEDSVGPDGKKTHTKIIRRTIKKKVGPKVKTTHITSEHTDDTLPIITVHNTEELTYDTATPLTHLHDTHNADVVEELPETVKVTQVRTLSGDVETVKTTKRVIKKKKGPKEEVTEITTIQKDDEAPITTVTVTEDTPEHVEDLQPIEIFELPQETTVEETKSPDGKPKQKKVTKRVIKKKVGPKVETTEIVTEQEDDQQPVVSVYKSEELTDDTVTPLKDLQEPDKAQVIEETPETVQVTQVRSETGDVKTVKTTKRVIKKKKGPKQEVTEITTIEKDDEAPITTVTVTEKQAPQEAEDHQPVEIVELPEETTFEDSVGPDGKKTHTKIITRTIKKKVGPKVKTTHITSEHTDDTLPIITVHNTEELTYDTATPLTHLHDTHNADVVEELPETVKVTQVRTLSGDVETVKTTKRVIKKKKGPKEEVTEITTIQKDDEAPITTVTVTEDTPEHVEDLQPIEIVELPQETTVEETKSPDGKPKQKKVTKRVIKKKVGPKVETTEIVTEQEDDQQPVVSVYKSEELTDDTVTPLKDLQEPDKAQVIEETPETVQVTQVRSETGDVKTVKTTKRVIKKKKGPKQEVTEITTIEKDDEAPITTVTVTEKQAPQEAEDHQPVEIVELPEETTFEDSVGPDGKKTHTKIIRRTIKKKVGPKVKTTHITSEHTDDTLPIITVHNTEELTYDTATPLTHLHDTHNADVVEELPETVKVTQVRTLSGDVETVKTTKRVIKKKKGPKEEVTEITTIQKDDEAPITTVTVTEDTPEHVEDLQPIEIVELPQETTVEETKSPDGKPKQKKVTKRVIKKKVGPKVETTEIVTEQEDDQQPVVSVYKSEELTDDTVTPLKDLQEPDKAQVIEETPETVQVTQVRSETGDVKTVKTTKRVIKKKKGPKQEVTEITTIEKDDEAPITTVTVTEKQAPQEAEDHQPVEIVELPEETTFEDSVGPDGDVETVKTTKRVIKKKKGPKEEVTEITTIQKDDEAPITTVTVTEDTPEHVEDLQPIEIVELPQETTVEETKSPDGKPKQKKVTKRVIKKKVGPKVETTEIVTEQEDDQQPVVSVYKSEELTDDTVTPLKDLQEPDKAQVIEETPETVQVTQVRSETGDVKTVKTTKRVIKKKKGPKQEVTEITTIEKDDEAPITTVTVTEKQAPQEAEDHQPVEIVELPEETTFEDSVGPDEKEIAHKKLHRPKAQPKEEEVPKSLPTKEEETVVPKLTKKLKPTPMKIEEIKMTEAQHAQEIQGPQFTKLKLKKPTQKPKQEVQTVILPKIQLKSRIRYVTEWPPEELRPLISFLGSVKQNGELSRNIKEAAKLKKKPIKVVQLPDLERVELEKPEVFDFDTSKPLTSETERSIQNADTESDEIANVVIKKVKNVPEISDIELIDETKTEANEMKAIESPVEKKEKQKEPETIEPVLQEQITEKPTEKVEQPIETENTIKPKKKKVTKRPVEPEKQDELPKEEPQILTEEHVEETEHVEAEEIDSQPKEESIPEQIEPIVSEKKVKKPKKKEKPLISKSESKESPEKELVEKEDIVDDTVKEQVSPDAETIVTSPIVTEVPKKDKKPKTKKVKAVEDTIPKREEEIPEKESVKEEIPEKESAEEQRSVEKPVTKQKPKLTAIKIERKEVEISKPQHAESIEGPQFTKLKLKKATTKPKQDTSIVTLPKFQLKSRVKYVNDWPPEIIKPVVSFLGSVRQNGILSRNVKEAEKVKKKVYKQPKLPEIEKTELEKPMFGYDDIIDAKNVEPIETDTPLEIEQETESTVDEPEQFTIKPKRPSIKKMEEIEDEVTIKKKLRTVRKPSVTLPEITEPETVTFRPKTTKTKEDVEQEFNIQLDSYAEEEISLTSKVKLKPHRQPTFNEEANEASIKFYEDTEDNEGPDVIEILESDDDEQEKASDVMLPLKKKTKAKKETLEEISSSITVSKPKRELEPEISQDVSIQLERKPKYKVDEQEEVSFDVKPQIEQYSQEELSLSSKIKLKPKKKTIVSEAADETSIQLIQEVEDDSQAEEILLSDVETEENVEMFIKRKPKKPVYEVSEVEELSVELKPKRITTEDAYEEEQLTISAKRKPRKPSTLQEADASMSISREQEFPETPVDVRGGDTVFAVYSYVAETDEAINLVEGERLYILETTNQDWWYVRKHLTEEKGWVPAQYLMDEANYTLYLQKKLNEKIDKLPVFEKPTPEEQASAPIFIEKLRPKHTPDGSTVQFECQVEGYPRPQITWFRQTAIIKPSQDFQMYYDDDNVATLVIREVFPEDAGTFTCVAKNAAGFASSTTELIVEAPLSDHGSEMTILSRKSLSRESSLADILEGIPPTFSKRPKAQYVNEGSQIFLECRLVAIPEPDIAWFFKGEEITPTENISIATESDMHMYCSVLKISDVKKFQEGTYTVLAVNREGEASLPIVLKIKTGEKEKPQVIEPLRSMTIREGESVVLSTQVVGNPQPTVTWHKNNKPVKSLTTKSDGDTHTITIIKPKKGKDDGVYTLKAVNSEGSTETSAVITIEEPTEENAEPPLFINRFQELTVKENGTIKLVAKVTGNPVPSITWYRNNNIITPSDNVTQNFDGENIELIISKVDSEIDSGDYKCVASNSAGKASHGARVTIDVDKVTFIKNLKSTYVTEEGKSVILECQTSHTVSTKWYHNDKEVSGMDHREIIQEGKVHKLRIKKTKLTDSGTIKCVVKGQETHSKLIVNETVPEFIRKLQDFEVKERDIAILEVEINSETADVIWEKDGETIKTKKNKYELEKRGNVRKLFIRNTSVHDEGEYTCKLRDDSCTAEVTVVELPPEIISRLQDQKVNKGSKATFEIELTKGDALVQWFKDGSEIQFSNHIQLTIDGKKQKLKIYDCELSDEGTYACEVGNDKCTANLIVEQPTVDFTLRLPESIVVPANTDAYLTVEIPDDSLDVTWYKKKTVIEDTEKFTLISDVTKRTLIIRKCTEDDQCEYSCVLCDAKCSTKLIVEVVEYPPKILGYENKYRVKRGGDVTLQVQYEAVPQPNDEWVVNSKIIKKTKHTKPTIDSKSASLTIKKVENTDAGTYRLRLENNCGETTVEIGLVVIDISSPPGKPTVVETTNNSINLCWDEPSEKGNTEIDCYIIEYQESNTTEWISIENIKTTQYSVKNLKTKSSYKFRVFAVNEVGVSQSSEETEFIIIQELVKAQPPTVEKPLKDIIREPDEDVELTCIFGGIPEPKVTWLKEGKKLKTAKATYINRVATLVITASETTEGNYSCIASNEHGEVETTCNLEVQQKPHVVVSDDEVNQKLRVGEEWLVKAIVKGIPKPTISWYFNGTKVEESEDITITIENNISIIRISELSRSHSGKYTIEANNKAGSTSFDVTLKVFDKPSKPEGPVVLREISRESVTIEWKPPLDDGGLELTKYAIEKHEPDTNQWVKVADVDKDVDTYCIQRLNENCEYMFRVMAQNPVGFSEALESEPIVIKTALDVPSPPLGPLGLYGINSDSLTITWYPSEKNGGSPILDYSIEIKQEGKKWKHVATVTETITKIEKLTVNTTYQFRICARNEIGTSLPYISDEKVTIGKTLSRPSKPQNFAVKETTSRSVTLQWAAPESDGGSVVTNYIIEYKTARGKSWTKAITVSGTVFEHCIENIKEKDELVFRISAENAIGVSLAAESQTVRLEKHATVPSPPTAPLEIRTVGTNIVMTSWGTPEWDGGAPLLGYNIAIRDVTKTMWMEVGKVDAHTLKFNIKDLNDNHTYMIRIYARNEIGVSEPLESDEPFKVIPGEVDSQADEEVGEQTEMTEPTSFSTQTTTSWMREHNMDADIRSYARGSLLRRDEYFFRIWHYAKQLFK